jgi:DNA-binding MarR family transcriptional regulator
MEKESYIFKLEKRRKIYNYVLTNPGTHFSKICRDLHIPKTTMFHHLKYLEKNDLIFATNQEKYSRYYVMHNLGNKDKELIGMIRRDTPRNILLLFLIEICMSRKDICETLEIHPNTVDYHLKKMIKADVIEPAVYNGKEIKVFNWRKPRVMELKPVGSEIIYKLKNPLIVYNAIIINKKSLLDDRFSKMLISYLEKNVMWPLPAKIANSRISIDKVVNVYFDICPIPFCA